MVPAREQTRAPHVRRCPIGVIVVCLSLTTSASAAEVALPPEVERFVADRDACDHFRGEPYEGDSPEQVERRKFVFESLDIYCSGADKRLAALRKRYKDNKAVMERLSKYEDTIGD